MRRITNNECKTAVPIRWAIQQSRKPCRQKLFREICHISQNFIRKQLNFPLKSLNLSVLNVFNTLLRFFNYSTLRYEQIEIQFVIISLTTTTVEKWLKVHKPSTFVALTVKFEAIWRSEGRVRALRNISKLLPHPVAHRIRSRRDGISWIFNKLL